MPASRPKGPDGRQVRWQEHNEARRNAILDAALAALEKTPPGEEAHVQRIAEEAGLSRTVIYRHFQDRHELDFAVQRRIVGMMRDELLPALSFEGTVRDIVNRIVKAYVCWSVRNPSLHRFVDKDLPVGGTGPLAEALEAIALQIEEIMNAVVALVGGELSAEDRAGLDPWVFGLIGGCFASVRRWLARPVREPGVDAFVDVMTDVIFFQIDGMARSRGINLPDAPVEKLLAGGLGDLGGDRSDEGGAAPGSTVAEGRA